MHEKESNRLIQAVSVFIFIILAVSLFLGMGPNLSAKFVRLGEDIWPGYAENLRSDPIPPDCSIEEIEEKQKTCVSQEGDTKDPFGDEDPFGEESSEKKEGEPFGDEDPFAEEEPKKDAEPFGDEDPFGGDEDPFAEDEDPFEQEDDPFAEKKNTPKRTEVGLSCAALENLAQRCEIRHKEYQEKQSKRTSGVLRYRKIEGFFSSFAKYPLWKHTLALLTLLGAFCSSVAREHISLRTAQTKMEERINQGMQFLALTFWSVSCYQDYLIRASQPEQSENIHLPLLWSIGFAVLALMSAVHAFRVHKLPNSPLQVSRALMVIPLYTYMGLIAGLYFSFVEGHASGMAIYLHKFVEVYFIYIGIGLYIWSGMLFATTRIAQIIFDVLLPWKLPIPILAWLVVVASAVPTAYSGASGIFVIAAGAVIFERLIHAGASKRIALAATAMSGSLGVVLRPCLVVVLIATLNKQVTTGQLFSYGLMVFALSATLLLIAMLRSVKSFQIESRDVAWPLSRAALKELAPYFIVALVVFLMYGLLLDTWINEHTAPLVLPGILLVVVIVERVLIRPKLVDDVDRRTLWGSLVSATEESSTHIGALLMVMAASVGLGGVVERAEVMNLFPQDFGSPQLAMLALVGIMVIVGMLMDALGAVVLVSVTLAGVAYKNGIDPVHFWMMVLVAFELGYLTPPVAINHLLARQVIGEAADVENDGTEGFYNKHEHLILPMIVMGSALIIVAFVPFFFYE